MINLSIVIVSIKREIPIPKMNSTVCSIIKWWMIASIQKMVICHVWSMQIIIFRIQTET